MTEDTLQYPLIIDNAMRGVVRDVLRRVQGTGLPGDHHFYISYLTTHPGVKISETLKSKYPKEITIVLQHQFWDFKIEESYFQVTLSFNGVPEKLTVPFAALTAFADPSVKFGLQFKQADAEETHEMVAVSIPEQQALPVQTEAKEVASAEVISLDAFRKK